MGQTAHVASRTRTDIPSCSVPQIRARPQPDIYMLCAGGPPIPRPVHAHTPPEKVVINNQAFLHHSTCCTPTPHRALAVFEVPGWCSLRSCPRTHCLVGLGGILLQNEVGLWVNPPASPIDKCSTAVQCSRKCFRGVALCRFVLRIFVRVRWIGEAACALKGETSHAETCFAPLLAAASAIRKVGLNSGLHY